MSTCELDTESDTLQADQLTVTYADIIALVLKTGHDPVGHNPSLIVAPQDYFFRLSP